MIPSSTKPISPVLVALGGGSVVALLLGALAAVWRLLASQSPSSPLYCGPLLGPVQALDEISWQLGALGLALALWIERLSLSRSRERRIALLLGVGGALVLLGFLAGAVLGTMGTQVIRAYPRTVVVLLLKAAGLVTAAVGLVSLCTATFSSRRSAAGPDPCSNNEGP